MADKLDKDGPVLSESDRARRQRELNDLDKDFQRRQREFREDLNQRRNEELATVLERTNRVIKQIAEAEKYDIVFQEAVYISPRIDITDKVLKALNK
jgi:outer membrane protein